MAKKNLQGEVSTHGVEQRRISLREKIRDLKIELELKAKFTLA